ncbi:MAG: NUDIX hydrolase [Leptospiraceae bacterium]|nr:NUDIX hydrolase [Leptospiraceae bacterium]
MSTTILCIQQCQKVDQQSKNWQQCSGGRYHYPLQGNAGCLILVQDKLLVVRDRESGRWGFPAGGPQGQEGIACTAVRETFEETGLRVQSRALIAFLPAKNFYLFECRLTTGGLDLPAAGENNNLMVPEFSQNEILAIRLIEIDSLIAADWRFPEQWNLVFDLVRARIKAGRQTPGSAKNNGGS